MSKPYSYIFWNPSVEYIPNRLGILRNDTNKLQAAGLELRIYWSKVLHHSTGPQVIS